ncbi:MAG: carboxypeptidase-like regulatory domain-containing protein [Melioribacteraceae bacterium]|nr:carboxypeptidase-like regulatory domain-containing protein [Melioribacteraceae bacterium]MCF8263555.1 carboxypeptidase-like regulatory domain-containing protein [Melioribacteraceae bacterium]MCF8430681.1 carboxypeptidase-like regulatory domain-containing protein [Melioribacteraceae bacterium]
MLKVISFFLLLVVFIGCGDDSPTESNNLTISGRVTFIDGTPAANADLRLIVVSSNQNQFTVTDSEGNYSFTELSSVNYQVNFSSQSYLVNSYTSPNLNPSDGNLVHDFSITYGILDEINYNPVSDSVFLIQYHPESGRIGNNFDRVNQLRGYYFRDFNGSSTLDCEVYEVSSSYNWANSSELTPSYVRANFTHVMSLTDSYNNSVHTVEFSDEDIPKILSNPVNGFAFIKTNYDNKVLRVPCVDFNNNDFGLRFEY